MTTCVIFLGVAMYCHATAVPPTPDPCIQVEPHLQICTVDEADDMPIYLSTYDPTQCDEFPINCDGHPEYMATGRIHPHHWGVTAACHPSMMFGTVTTPFGTYTCLDTGGGMRPTFKEYWSPVHGFTSQWAVIVDVLHTGELPNYFYGLYDNWQFAPVR